MKFRECKNLIKSDLKRISGTENKSSFFKFFITSPAFKLVLFFRLGNYLSNRRSILHKFFYILVYLLHRYFQYLTGIQFSFCTKIGKGIMFPHFSCIVINSTAIIGDNCTIFQGVTIGSVRGKGTPVIGDNVVLSPGSKVVGDVKIGSNVFVAPNAVVVKDVEDYSTVAGIPAKTINKDGEKNVSQYIN